MVKKASLPTPVLFGIASVCLTAGWLIASFPILIFVGLAPLFALADRPDPRSPVWEKMELILLALGIAFVSAAIVLDGSIVAALVASIGYTVAFVAHAWVRQTLGHQVGKTTIVLFWLSFEYLSVKFGPESSMFLADTLRLQPTWTRWTVDTGYLGSSLWILGVNWSLYKTFLNGAVQWGWMPVMVLLFFGPAIYSYPLTESPITRQEMINLYSAGSITADVTYLARGEFVVRTATWLSTLILLFSFVRNQTARR